MDSKKTAAELRREYLKEWRKQHPDKVRQYNIAYWKRRADREKRGENDNAEASNGAE